MIEGEDFRRRWSASWLRLVVVLAVIAVAAWTFYAGSAAEMHRMQDPHVLTYWRVLVMVAAAPLMWLIPFGATADHYLSRFGARAVLVVHLIGVHVAAIFVVFVVASVRNAPPLGGPYLTLWFAAPALWVLIGFAAAGLVPGSFPSGSSRVRAWRRSAPRMPTEAPLVKDSHDVR